MKYIDSVARSVDWAADVALRKIDEYIEQLYEEVGGEVRDCDVQEVRQLLYDLLAAKDAIEPLQKSAKALEVWAKRNPTEQK